MSKRTILSGAYKKHPPWAEIAQNVVVGLTVSFVALSLGAALGILAGRGAFAGMLSAGIIALITALFGGTRVQCSGPTAPMSAVTATVVAFAFERLPASLAISPDQFVNLTLLIAAGLLVGMALLRLGRFITAVPNVVISGFMTGIALLIWRDQVRVLFGIGGKAPIPGPMLLNLLTAGGTVVLVFALAPLTRRLVGARARFLPATLLAILLMTLIADIFAWPIGHVELAGSGGGSPGPGLFDMIAAQWPTGISGEAVLAAFPFALQLAMLCYLDTLLTSLVIDSLSGEPTGQDRELAAQGLANGLAGLVGGIPGAQATIRSVLMLKENATLRLAGVMVGLFVLVEMVLFRGVIELVPQAVFAGILFKVGYDVLDIRPLRLYLKEVGTFRGRMFRQFFSRHDDQPIFVTNREMVIILGTAFTTLFFGLNEAVFGFSLLFYLHNKILNRRNPMRDLKPVSETEVFLKQN